MDSSSTMILLGVGAVVVLLLILLGPAENTVGDGAALQPAGSAAIGAETVSRPSGAPTVHAGSDRTVEERETVQLDGRGTAPGGGAVTYLWTDGGALGFFANARSPTTAYTAPSVCGCEQRVTLTLTATSADGVSVSDSMVLTVRDPLNCPTGTHEICGAFTTPLDPCRCIGAEATCPARPAEPCASPCMTYVPAPTGCPEAPFPCPCAVSGCEAQWTSGWPFGSQPEHPRDRAKPRIGRQYRASMAEGSAMPIAGYIDNPACVSVCFTWSVTKGWLEGADTLQPIYHAPQSDRRDGESATITLTVHDGSGGRSYDQIRIHIDNVDGS
jgi:hypothetical protein